MTPPTLAEVQVEAARLGFVACGVASLEPSRRADALDAWLASGRAGTMRYLHRQAKKRKQPATIHPEARTAVMVLDNYAAASDEQPQPGDAFKVASYARGTDYHLVTLGRLLALKEWLISRGASFTSAWVDDGPVPERELAERAGLGWIGKNAMLINPRLGSWTFIGSVFTDLVIPADAALDTDRCGSCTRCLDACPTEAIVAPRVLDATRCLSYLSIEYKPDPPPELDGRWAEWAFGCDICNSVCPWNEKFAEPTTIADFRRRPHPDRRDPAAFDALDDAEFTRRYADSPLARPGLVRMRRNVRHATAGRQDAES
ncbi:MAG: tRNA epoxyqueuosine(34) reductase QueG [Gemmatimonadetes bacterium]|nr:tRNA epoxyqueuosine(34) reductase QueG [Gemmatimonadota bacterium]